MTALLIARNLLGGMFRWFDDNPWRLALLSIAVLALLYWRADARADRYAAQVEAERSAHAETLVSLKIVRDELDVKNAESQARADAFARARQDSAEAQAKAARDYAATQRRIDALLASVGKNEPGKCDVPEEVLYALR